MLLVEFAVVILQLYIKTHTHTLEEFLEIILFLYKVYLQGVPKKRSSAFKFLILKRILSSKTSVYSRLKVYSFSFLI